jgi:hypothetical protein
MWIGGFLIVGAAAHAAIFMVRDYESVMRVLIKFEALILIHEETYHRS